MRRRSLKREGAVETESSRLGFGRTGSESDQHHLREAPGRGPSLPPRICTACPPWLSQKSGPPALGSGGRASQVTSGSEATTVCVPLGSAPNNTSVVIKTGLPSLWLYETVPGPLEEGGSEDTQECPALDATGLPTSWGSVAGPPSVSAPLPTANKQTNGQRPGRQQTPPPRHTESPRAQICFSRTGSPNVTHTNVASVGSEVLPVCHLPFPHRTALFF